MASLIRDRATAIEHRYIVINPPTQVHWLTFDLDHSDSWIWESAGLPQPNFIVRDPVSGHSHITYAIESVCVSKTARQAPIRYMEAIRRTYARLLKADESYTNRITKNPFSSHWLTTWLHAQTYSLGELSDYVDVLDAPIRHRDIEVDTNRRNCSVFNLLRCWAYQRVNQYRQGSHYQAWYNAIYDKALNLSREVKCPHRGTLNANEAGCIARSVARWTWHHYRGHKTRILELDESLSIKERQQLGAKHTHKTRQQNTEQKILKAIKTLKQTGQRVTKAAVAKRIAMSRQQLSKRYAHLFDLDSPLSQQPSSHSNHKHSEDVSDSLDRKEEKQEIPQTQQTQQNCVNFALHQVTAPLTHKKNNLPTENEWEKGWESFKFFPDSKIDRSAKKHEQKRYPESKVYIFPSPATQTLNSDLLETATGKETTAFITEDDLRIEMALYLFQMPKLDALPPPFTPEFEEQLIDCILEEQLTKRFSVDIIVEVMAKVLEEPHQPLKHSLSRWRPYIQTIAHRIRQTYGAKAQR